MDELEVKDPIVIEDDQQNLAVAPEHNQGDSDGGEQGGDTNSEMGNSLQSSHQNSEAQDDAESAGGVRPHTDSQAPVSSRGSTRATGEDDSMSLHSAGGVRYGAADPRHPDRRVQDAEPERDQYGHPLLTNRYLRDLFRTEWKKYYRTPELNEKLFLHFKGFAKMQNLGQFKQLKCLYFEGNGCDSLLGLEENTELRSLFIQENAIRKMEGLDTLKALRQFNLNENFITKVEGLSGCEQLDTLYLKRNRLGRDESGDIACLQGLLECPTLSCVDISENDLSDPAIMEEVIYKMPSLRVLYLQGNPVCRKIDHYRKKIICSIPSLKYLDDRPVFEEDRRRAEAWARGGMEEERAEMKRIKKEKEDKHWANHEAFQIMIKNAKAKREVKAEAAAKEETVTERKETMKEMMARAKAERQAAGKNSKLGEKLEGEYRNEGDYDRTFFDAVAEKAEQRFQEKQAGVEHVESVPEEELAALLGEQRQGVEALAKEYDAQEAAERLKPMPKSVDEKAKKPKTMQELEDAMEAADNDDEEAPDLEEVDQAELEKVKQEKQQEWLDKIVAKNAETNQIREKPAEPESKEEADKEEEEEEDIDAILSDEKRVREAQAAVTADQIQIAMEDYAEAAQAKGPIHGTDFDELD